LTNLAFLQEMDAKTFAALDAFGLGCLCRKGAHLKYRQKLFMEAGYE
jgi:hypothetical protein